MQLFKLPSSNSNVHYLNTIPGGPFVWPTLSIPTFGWIAFWWEIPSLSIVICGKKCIHKCALNNASQTLKWIIVGWGYLCVLRGKRRYCFEGLATTKGGERKEVKSISGTVVEIKENSQAKWAASGRNRRNLQMHFLRRLCHRLLLVLKRVLSSSTLKHITP